MIDRVFIGVGRAIGGGVLWLALIADPARAQRALSGTPTTQSSAMAVVPFLWLTKPSVLTDVRRSRQRCDPGDCFSQMVAVSANANWQLQVKLIVPATGFTVDLSTPSKPDRAVARLSASNWTPTAVNGRSTANRTSEVTFYARKTSGGSGRVPTSTDVARLLQYQVVRAP
jgi:hypothetical protein